MRGKKETTLEIPDSEQSLENLFKDEFVKYSKSKGKEINQGTFWDSANGLMLSFLFKQLSIQHEINANLRAGIEDLHTAISQNETK